LLHILACLFGLRSIVNDLDHPWRDGELQIYDTRLRNSEALQLEELVAVAPRDRINVLSTMCPVDFGSNSIYSHANASEWSTAKQKELEALARNVSLYPAMQRAIIFEQHSALERLASLNVAPRDFISAFNVASLQERKQAIDILVQRFARSAEFSRELDLSFCEDRLINCVLELIKQVSLKELTLASSGLSTVPWMLLHFTRLGNLNLESNRITVPLFPWASLSLLRVLNLSRNQIQIVPDEIEMLSSLEELYLEWNVISALPESLCDISTLRVLNVANNAIESLPNKIGMLHSLEQLYLNHNSLSKLPDALFGLAQLRRLIASHNKISAIPACAGNLMKLVQLDLQYNEIMSLPDTMGKLASLEELFINNNNIKALPATLGYLKQIRTLDLIENNLIEPRSLLLMGCSELKKYLRETLFAGERCNRCKVVIVGMEGIGKTCIVRALAALSNGASMRKSESILRRLFEENKKANLSTDGVDVQRIGVSVDKALGFSGNRLELQLFDFGGQEVFAMTHSFFISPEAVYLVAFNPLRKDSENRLGYWLSSLLAMLSKQSKGIMFKTIVVATHADEASPELIEERFAAILARPEAQRLALKHHDCFAVSSLSGIGMSELVDAVRDRALKLSGLVGERFPHSFYYLRQYASERAASLQKQNKPPIVKWSEFVCEAVEILNAPPIAVVECSAILHKQGLLMHYENDKALRDWVIVDPQWLPKLMASIVSFRTVGLMKDALLLNSDIAQHKLWTTFGNELYQFLMAMLLRFCVIVALDDSNVRSLVPAMLFASNPGNQPPLERSQAPPQHRRRYTTNFIPRDLFPRLLAKLLQFLPYEECKWPRWGAFEWKQGSAEASVVVGESEVELWVWGNKEEAANIFRTLHSQILSTTQFWSNLNVAQSIVLVSGETIAFSGLDFARKDLLPEFEEWIDEGELSEWHAIGKGAFGNVWKAHWQPAKRTIAVKEIACDEMEELTQLEKNEKREQAIVEMTQESHVMQRLKHNNVIEFFGVTLRNGNPAMAIEFAQGGSLMDMLHNKDVDLPYEFALRVANDVARAMVHLHSQRPRVIHRDLKSGNVLLMCRDVSVACALDLERPFAKLSDFGMTVHAVSSIELDTLSTQNPRWLAPEIMRGEPHNHISDVYSFGMLLWELSTRKIPFAEKQWKYDHHVETAVLSGVRPSLQGVQSSVRELIEVCWAGNPELRTEFKYIQPRIFMLLQEHEKKHAATPRVNIAPSSPSAVSAPNSPNIASVLNGSGDEEKLQKLQSWIKDCCKKMIGALDDMDSTLQLASPSRMQAEAVPVARALRDIRKPMAELMNRAAIAAPISVNQHNIVAITRSHIERNSK
jgi:serine/threonine protein kinase